MDICLYGFWASSLGLTDPVGIAAPTSSTFQYKVSLTQSVHTGVEEAACCPSSWANGTRRAREIRWKRRRRKGWVGREGGQRNGGKQFCYCISEVSGPEDQGSEEKRFCSFHILLSVNPSSSSPEGISQGPVGSSRSQTWVLCTSALLLPHPVSWLLARNLLTPSS